MPAREDGMLLVEFAKWGTMLGTDEAAHAVFQDDFDPAAATIEDQNVRRLLQYGETLATLTKNGLLDRDLALDWLWVAGIWDRVGPAALKQREKYGVPELYENMEALAAVQAQESTAG